MSTAVELDHTITNALGAHPGTPATGEATFFLMQGSSFAGPGIDGARLFLNNRIRESSHHAHEDIEFLVAELAQLIRSSQNERPVAVAPSTPMGILQCM